MKEPYLRLIDIVKTFGNLVAVNGVSLDVEEGEFVCILGPSGCGKTTLLRIIAGLEEQDSGQIIQGGRDVSRLPPRYRDFGIVFQSYALFPNMTAAQNIAYGLETRKWPRERIEARVKELLELVGLPDVGHKYPAQLSGGQQQRIALARALAPSPGLLLLDEPLSALDARVRVSLRREIKHLQRRIGVTTIFVTHDQEEALFMGDRLAVLLAGRLEQEGTPEAVYGNPASRSLAEFLGHAEFIPGTVTQAGVETELGMLAQRVDLPPGSSVEVGFRADDVSMEADEEGEAVVLARIFRGGTSLFRVQLPSGRIVHTMQPHTLTLQPGCRVRLWLEPNHPLPCYAGGKALPVLEFAPPAQAAPQWERSGPASAPHSSPAPKGIEQLGRHRR